MIKPCRYCGDNSVYTLAKVTGFAECFYDDIDMMASEQNIDKLNWEHRTTVYCVRCGRRRKNLRLIDGVLKEVKHERAVNEH